MGRLSATRLQRVGRDDRLSVVEHLDELRRRVIVSLIALVVAFAVAYAFHDQLLEILQWPLPDRYKDSGLITLSPTEPFFTVLKVCFWTAILVALPMWLYQLYAFVIPAVQDQPRRRMLAIVAGASAPVPRAGWRSATSSCCPSPSSGCSASGATTSTPRCARASTTASSRRCCSGRG